MQAKSPPPGSFTAREVLAKVLERVLWVPQPMLGWSWAAGMGETPASRAYSLCYGPIRALPMLAF
jgi:hypothetical protein